MRKQLEKVYDPKQVQAVSRWEMGTALPDAPNLLRISKRFGGRPGGAWDTAAKGLSQPYGLGNRRKTRLKFGKTVRGSPALRGYRNMRENRLQRQSLRRDSATDVTSGCGNVKSMR